MAKKDIGKILTTGSAKQRILLIAEDMARAIYGKDRLLTEHDYNQLSDSFRTTSEIRLWNEFRGYGSTVGNGIMNLQGIKFEVMMHYADLRGYILVWNSVENAELLANSLLHEVKDPEERKRIAQDGAKGIDLLFTQAEVDAEGYLEIMTDFEKESYRDENGKRLALKEKPVKTKKYSLAYVMGNVRKEAEATIVKYLSWEKALLDYMDEKGFNVKTYKDQIHMMTEHVKSPVIGWDKYSGKLSVGTSLPRLEEILKKYNVSPRLNELEVDPQEYHFFKTNILGDE